MNANRLARAHGFFDFRELVALAKEAKRLKSELRDERARHAPLLRQIAELSAERLQLTVERESLVQAWRALAESYADRGSRVLQEHQALTAISRAYEEHARRLESVPVWVRGVTKENESGQERQGRDPE